MGLTESHLATSPRKWIGMKLEVSGFRRKRRKRTRRENLGANLPRRRERMLQLLRSPRQSSFIIRLLFYATFCIPRRRNGDTVVGTISLKDFRQGPRAIHRGLSGTQLI